MTTIRPQSPRAQQRALTLFRKQRARRLMQVLTTVDRTLTGRVDVHCVSDDNIPHPSQTDGTKIQFNGNLVVSNVETAKGLATLHGLNYHELCHVLYTPRAKSQVMKAVNRVPSPLRHHAFNILEDQRIERLMVARYPRTADYFTITVSQLLTNVGTNQGQSTPEDMEKQLHMLINQRRYLPAKMRRQARTWFVKHHGEDEAQEAEDIIKAYCRLTVNDKNAGKAARLVERFADLMNRVNPSMQNHMTSDCGSTAVHEGPAPDSGEEQQAQQSAARRDKDKDQEDEEDKERAEKERQKSQQQEDKDTDEDEEQEDDTQDTGDGDTDDNDTGDEEETDAGDGQDTDQDEDGEDQDDQDGSSGGDQDGDEDEEGDEEDSSGSGGDADGDDFEDDFGDDFDGGSGDSGGNAPGSDGETGDEGGSDQGGTGSSAGGTTDGPKYRDEDTADYDDMVEDLTDLIAETVASDNIQEDVKQTRQSMTSGGKVEYAGSDIQSVTQPVTLEMRRDMKSFSKELLKYQDDADPGWNQHQSSGKLNVGRYMKGDALDSVFDQWHEDKNDALDIEAVLLIDMSASMGRSIGAVSRSLWVLHAALDQIRANVQVLGFSDETVALSRRGQRAPMGQYDDYDTIGGTNPIDGLKHAQQVFKQSRRKQKLLFVLTDGEWDGYYAAYHNGESNEDYIDAMNNAGVVTALAFIADSHLRQAAKAGQYKINDHHCAIVRDFENPEELVPMVKDIVRAMIRSGM